MTLGALYLLEVNLSAPRDANLITMAAQTLGKFGAGLTWLVYLMLLYTLLSAYTNGFGDVVHDLVLRIHQHAEWIDVVAATVVLAILMFSGMASVDWVNRALMLMKLTLFCILSFSLVPILEPLTFTGSWQSLMPATMVIVTSFGYAIVIPSLRDYLDNDAILLRKAVYIGSLVPLLIYLAWSYMLLSILDHDQLAELTESPHALSSLITLLQNATRISWMHVLVLSFSGLAVATSFLGASLATFDFLRDGFGLNRKKIFHRALLVCLIYVPACMIAIMFPKAFVYGFKFAGYWCVLLLILLPVFMSISRRIYQMPTPFQVPGGWAIITLTVVLSVVLLLTDLF